jgi:uncharacterized damage-inducible protein DinB
MKELLQQYASYHLWANGLLTDVINSLPEENQIAEVPSSFRSLYLTLLHMWDAEYIWWQRMKLREKISIPSETFNGNTKELTAHLIQQNRQWQDWIAAANEPQLQHVFSYFNSKRIQFKQPVYQALLHLFNHGTYHRGQLVNMMRQLGVTRIPQTDFIVWSRKKG